MLTASFPRSPSFHLFSVVQTHLLWRATTGILSFSTITSRLPNGRRPQEALQDQQEHPPDPDLSVSFPLLSRGRHPPAPGPSAESFLSLQLSTRVPVSSQGPRFLENAAPSQRPPCLRMSKRITLNPIILGPSQNSTHFVITAGALPRLAPGKGGATGAAAVSVLFPTLVQTRQRLSGTRGSWLVGQPGTPCSALGWIFLSSGVAASPTLSELGPPTAAAHGNTEHPTAFVGGKKPHSGAPSGLASPRGFVAFKGHVLSEQRQSGAQTPKGQGKRRSLPSRAKRNRQPVGTCWVRQGAQAWRSAPTSRGGREVQEEGDRCVPVADSCSCVADTNTTL